MRTPADVDAVLSLAGVAVPEHGLRDVTVTVHRGARHAVIADPAAGAALVAVLAGEQPVSGGQLLLHGRPLTADRAADGVGFVRLTPRPTSAATVAGAVTAIRRRRPPVRTTPTALDGHQRAAAILRGCGLAEDLLTPVDVLPPGKRRLLDLAIAQASDADLIVIEEPNARLTGRDIHQLSLAVATLPTATAVLYLAGTVTAVAGLASHITAIQEGRSLPPTSIAGLPGRAQHPGELALTGRTERPRLTADPVPIGGRPPSTLQRKAVP